METAILRYPASFSLDVKVQSIHSTPLLTHLSNFAYAGISARQHYGASVMLWRNPIEPVTYALEDQSQR